MTAARCTFQKYERLKKAQDIDTLFQNGKAFSILPIKVLYAIKEQSTASASCKVAFAAPKKLFRKSVERQNIKRHLREAYRLNKASFIEASVHGDFAIVTGGTRWRPMLKRLAQSLGYGTRLRHIETVAPSGAQMLADPEMALRCLRQACQDAARPGVRAIILGGAGLAGYAQLLQPHVSLPLIDSAQAGLRVLLQGQAPPALRQDNGFHAQWSNVFRGAPA
jgi:ribonuclease P protein component